MFADLLAYLEGAGVRFVVVGGVAVVIHGHARLTADVDLVIDLAPDNVRSAIDALTSRGFRPTLPVDAAGFADEATRREWIEARNLQVFSLVNPANPFIGVDLFAREPIPFHELWSRADVIDLNGHRSGSLRSMI